MNIKKIKKIKKMSSFKKAWEMTFEEFVASFPFERGASEDIDQGLTISPGEAGEGVYAYVINKNMREHYTSQGEDVIKIKPKEDTQVVDLTEELDALVNYVDQYLDTMKDSIGQGYIRPKITKGNVHRFSYAIEEFVNSRYPNASAYIVPHHAPNIPSGKQVVIRKPEDMIAIKEKELQKIHHQMVEKAISEFMPVPAKVLKDYPDLDQDENLLGDIENTHEVTGSKNLTNSEILTMKFGRHKDEKITAEMLEAYVNSLKLYAEDNPDIDEDIKRLITNLPTATKIKKDFSGSECEILYETVGYLWKHITGKDILEQKHITNAKEELHGSYWIIKDGLMLHGVNHRTIARQQFYLICSMLHIHVFAMHQHMASHPDSVIHVILRNGGIRMFVSPHGVGYFQMTDDTYGKWGKKKVKKFDLKKKVVKIIDPKQPYHGWKSGIVVLL